ncbi:succinyldiaminopimelate transaminase [Solemya pervernicosa gill symbiont]|uniref:Succinyldiaminopimelate transaminase n=2 Tax=Gammaproteobacteria incertae sedis TaxID=118884 RepID=A0A1T2L565_9GAMM|nr:succinyldiaminopimelate transaminase [Candidatus Reidiella endopervernicosa]OOZ40229.1 succinyldiaminopimelate transaminase [Solemya pervernicosa gill symbiont]QKQ27113.1 succinyldiaminopimelate transaminase [Candidatus Reidiella endopervernicosa]
MNPDLDLLQPYPFERLKQLKAGIEPPAGLSHIPLSIGEPKHAAPGFVTEELITHLHTLSSYPLTKGMVELRGAISDWLIRRFNLPAESLDIEQQILPVNGTREALFAFAQAIVDRNTDSSEGGPLVVMPNPFYQIYEGAALLAGAEPLFLNATADNRYLPDFDAVPEAVWQRCQLIYICSPGNPTGAVIGEAALKQLIELADRYDFIIASDECYSELYPDESQPPVGLLEVAAKMGRNDYKRCVVFHSLSKRSNLPGLRSGFVAGDAEVLSRFLLYRTYHGCAMPPASQHASIKAWQDEQHVETNRELYRQKFDAVLEILSPVLEVSRPDAGFYLWARTPINECEFAQGLFAAKNITVLPGSYLSRDAHGENPGSGHVRMALVATLESCIEAAHRIRDYIETI